MSLIEASDAPAMLLEIRPEWQARNLITRVKRLIRIDPSSACQRLFNASIHDLREKVVIAGIDIAKEAASQNRLPPIISSEDVENYSTAKLIDLVYRIGLLTRPEWRRLSRCYEIRRDLEHEDDEYEAGVEDCIYIFKTCIDCVLSKDPIHLVQIRDVKELVEQSESAAPSETLTDDFKQAPNVRQEEIIKFLVSIALDEEKSDIVQQNAYRFLVHFRARLLDAVRLEVARHIQSKLGRGTPTMRQARVAVAAGPFPYLRRSQINDFFDGFYDMMKQVGYNWGAYDEHGELFRVFRELEGFTHVPTKDLPKFVLWCMLCYIGTAGGRTRYGNIRHVYYSNSAAPHIRELFTSQGALIREHVASLETSKKLKESVYTEHLQARLEELLDMVDAGAVDGA
ncbi:hypothetical protein [Neorhodopirellula lusitana]|uniref:hypothetical protein n=1 Tax=Neorhodopirellula lusitana TaxID=445327 RepID=UPI00384CF449